MTILRWYGPLSFRQLLSDQAVYSRWRCPGLYIWTERVEGPHSERPDPGNIKYVGRSRDLADRNLRHYLEYIACHYDVPLPNLGDWQRKLDADGRRRLLDLPLLTRVLHASFGYARGIRIYFAQVRVPTPIERTLIYTLKPRDNLRGWRRRPARLARVQHRGRALLLRAIRIQERNAQKM